MSGPAKVVRGRHFKDGGPLECVPAPIADALLAALIECRETLGLLPSNVDGTDTLSAFSSADAAIEAATK